MESVTALGLEGNLKADDLKLSRAFPCKEHSAVTHGVVPSVVSSMFVPLRLAPPFTFGIGLILRPF